jgi:hypothetical protein
LNSRRIAADPHTGALPEPALGGLISVEDRETKHVSSCEVFSSISVGQIQVVSLTQGEAALQDILSDSLGAGEREGIAVARERHGTVLSNETRVAHCCRQNQIPVYGCRIFFEHSGWRALYRGKRCKASSTICG